MLPDNADGKDRPGSPGKSSARASSPVHQQSSEDYAKSNLLQIPSINLPKGGGALKSIDEKFQVNAANGTSSFSIAIPFSKSRSDFAPSLSLSYNSGGGNSPFGLGWNINLPSIKRRTDKLLPRYHDALDSDIFQIAGAEDLVLKLMETTPGKWQPDVPNPAPAGNYMIKRYRPRIEGAFTLIEQVISPTIGMYWKTTGKDNTVTFYGISASGRVADPADPLHVYEWLPEISYDNKKNCFQFIYVSENLDNVPILLHEGNRLNGKQAIANTYLKQIVYGNTMPYDPVLPGGITDPYQPMIPDKKDYLFSLVLDYGDHDKNTPTPLPSAVWGCRLDPFSNCKPGFDMRTYRLCRRFLLFHNFPELDANPVLVKSLDLMYHYYDFQPVADPYLLNFVEADFITSITETGWIGNSTTGYQRSGYPPISFTYQMPNWNSTVQTVSAQNRMNIPEGLNAPYQFTDLYNEGIAGVLSEQSEGWYYNSNLGDGVFTPASLIAPKPSFTGLQNGSLQLQSLTGDGRKFIVSTARPNQGYFELTDHEQWLPFTAFEQYPSVDTSDPNIKFIDLNGDGMPDIVLSEEQAFMWYPATGISGYDSPELAPKPFDEESGPAIVFADPVQSIFLADMTGDGLIDIVRIRNGEICYWPNMGYGIFGAKTNMSNAPVFDTIDMFNAAYLHLSDINGTGVTDIIYLGQDKLRAWLNLSGNAWAKPFEAPAFPNTASPNQLAVTDFLGNGTACIVWSSPLTNNADDPMRYIDLMGGRKPYLINTYTNGMGKQITINYESSTHFYLKDKIAGTPWITKLSFPVQCVQRITVADSVSGTNYSSSYTYHHGYYDHLEKEYRGFGRVEQTDTDFFDTNASADQAPILTKTWFHTGAYFGMKRILQQFSEEYFKNPSSFAEYNLPEPALPPNLTADEAHEAVRACKGMTLRQEVYALDGDINMALTNYPYSVAEHNNNITIVQPRGPNLYAVFLSTESENITYHYERNPADPRIAHVLNTAIDEYGNIKDSYSVVYPRQTVNPASPGGMPLPGGQPLPPAVIAEQQNTYIVYTQHAYTSQIINTLAYRLPVVCETITYQCSGINPSATYFSIDNFAHPPVAPVLARLKHQRTLFLNDDLATPMPLYNMDTMGLVYQQYHLAFDSGVTVLSGKATTAVLQSAHYVQSAVYNSVNYFPAADPAGQWWVPSGVIAYLNAGVALPFLLPYQYLDGYGYPTTLGYDGHYLVPVSITDAVKNTTVAVIDYRVLEPQTVTDSNQNVTEFKYDILGLVVAIALKGKGEGDAFDPGFTADLTSAQVAGFFSDPYTNGPALLQGATTRYIYDFVSGGPFSAGIIARQIHANQVPDPRVDITSVPYHYSFEYTDGLGHIAMKKVQADMFTGNLALSKDCDGGSPATHRWIGTGKTVYNNKGKPVMQYEPYFSNTPMYETAPVHGVSLVLHYDPAGRLIKTNFPDDSFSSTEFDAWVEIFSDQNDNVGGSGWYANSLLSPDALQRDAANKTFLHNITPTANHLDPLGRNFYSVAFNIVAGSPVLYATQTILDLESNPLSVIDAMQNPVMQWTYDLLNRPICQISMDAGTRWILHDIMDKPFMQWDINAGNNFIYSYSYDHLHRPLQNSVSINGTSYLSAYNVYGEDPSIPTASAIANNLLGKLYHQFDGSGLVTHYCYDFKSNLVQSSRRFTANYKSADNISPVVNWTGTEAADMNQLEKNGNIEYVSLTQYDALNRPVLSVRPFLTANPGQLIAPPYNQAAVNKSDVIIQGYGESGSLNTVNVYRAGVAAGPTVYVKRICHNEKGQRLCIQYGNNTVTKYYYDTNTFRLIRLYSTANTGTKLLQDLNYYYDPVGNITYSLDNAQPPVFYNNQQVLSDGNYTYDAVYRLVGAKGREHIAQNTVDESSANDNFRNYPFAAANPLPLPSDPKAVRNYTDTYLYDAVGNMLQLQHVANGGSYTRVFSYNNNNGDRALYAVPITRPKNNQLLATKVGTAAAIPYTFDDHGNMLNLPQLHTMAWDFQDRFVAAGQQVVTGGNTGQVTYYNYDGSGMRTRKVTEGASAATHLTAKTAERLYFNDFEIYHKYDVAGSTTLERETLHIMDDKSRAALCDYKTIDNANNDSTSTGTYYDRYQYNNHLQSSMMELDDSANVISYEEYHPYGTTSYQAADTTLDVPPKRYRYTGKERDEESGLYYHGARYYAPWLCRWTAADPDGILGGINLYVYGNDNPVRLNDPTGKTPQETQKDQQSSVFQKVDRFIKRAASILEIQNVLNQPTLDVDQAFSALKTSYTKESLDVTHTVTKENLRHGTAVEGKKTKVGDVHPTHFLSSVELYKDESGKTQILHYTSKASIQTNPNLAIQDHVREPHGSDIQIILDPRNELQKTSPGVVVSQSIFTALAGKPGSNKKSDLIAGIQKLPLGTLGTVRTPEHPTGVPARVADLGPFRSAGEITIKLAQMTKVLVGGDASKEDVEKPIATQYDFLTGTAKNSYATKEVLPEGTGRELANALRERLLERLQQLSKL